MAAFEQRRRRRLFRLLRRAADGSSPEEARAAEEGALWGAHGRAAASVRRAGEAGQRIASQVAKQRASAEALADRARGVSARSGECSAIFGRLEETFARMELVALNAGLEGARLGEGPGRALELVSEDIRGQTARGAEACRELGAGLSELGSELAHVRASLEAARELSGALAQEAADVTGACREAERALDEMTERLKKTTSSDPEAARAVEEVAEHARALVTALGRVNGKAPRATLAAALRPVLGPALRLFEGSEEL